MQHNAAGAGPSFAEAAIALTCERAVRECWTRADMDAALLQSALVSYRSHEDYAQTYGGDTGNRYSDSDAGMYTSNCPWNDWTPPSESERLFLAAAAGPRVVDAVSRRVRVRIVPQTEGTVQAGVIVFATLEVNDAGKEVIVIRRGADTLATLIKRKIRMTPHLTLPGHHVLTASARNAVAPLILFRFEDARRLEVFERMLHFDA
jgi:hypothetical protein